MNAEFEVLEVPLDAPFTISRGTTETATVAVVRIEDEGTVGIGAATPAAYYGETSGTVEAVLPDLLSVAEGVDDPFAFDRIEGEMKRVVHENPAAKAAVDIALHDLACKRLDVPLYRYLGLDPDRTVRTCQSLGIDDPETVGERAAAAVEAGHEVLKVKVGTENDREIVSAVREAAPDARIHVDANEAWRPKEAVREAWWLADQGIEFVEQPVPADEPEGLRYVYEHAPLPVAADESCEVAADVPRVADRSDIVVLKLMKCGGIREALRTIHTARAHGLDVMLGCMVESHASIAPAAHLTPLVDHADLDGPLLLEDDPYTGPVNEDGRIDLDADRPGTGAREK